MALNQRVTPSARRPLRPVLDGTGRSGRVRTAPRSPSPVAGERVDQQTEAVVHPGPRPSSSPVQDERDPGSSQPAAPARWTPVKVRFSVLLIPSNAFPAVVGSDRVSSRWSTPRAARLAAPGSALLVSAGPE